MRGRKSIALLSGRACVLTDAMVPTISVDLVRLKQSVKDSREVEKIKIQVRELRYRQATARTTFRESVVKVRVNVQ